MEWHNVVCYEMAEIAENILQKENKFIEENKNTFMEDNGVKKYKRK